MSGGTVLAISPTGPVFRGRRAPRRSFRPDTFVPALAAPDRMVVAGLTVAWLACVAWFWVWWLQPENRVSWVGLLAASVVPLYLSCEPISYLLAANRLRRVDLPLPSLRVAFVVTRAPSEPWLV